MALTKDMRELLEILERHGVRYMVVGGFAVNYYGYVRTTQDIDLLLYPSPENAEAVMAALTEFGFGGAGIPQDCFEKEGTAIHLGVEPNRIDLLTHLKGIDNDRLFSNMQKVKLEDAVVNIISREDLVATKRRSGRIRDRADAEELTQIEGKAPV